MKLKFDPAMVTYTHSSHDYRQYTTYKMPFLAKLTLEKVADLPEDRVRVKVVANESGKSCGMHIRKNELVGTEYTFDSDCFVPL